MYQTAGDNEKGDDVMAFHSESLMVTDDNKAMKKKHFSSLKKVVEIDDDTSIDVSGFNNDSLDKVN